MGLRVRTVSDWDFRAKPKKRREIVSRAQTTLAA